MSFCAYFPSSKPSGTDFAEPWEEGPEKARQRNLSVQPVKYKPTEKKRLRGRVLEGSGRLWLVQLEDELRTLLRCTVAGTVVVADDSPTLLAVGDSVECVLTKEPSLDRLPQGVIVSVHPRHTKLARYRRREGKEQIIASNVNQLVVLQAVAEPEYDRFLIDRYLIAAEKGGLRPVLCINKIDLGSERHIRKELRFYPTVLGVPLVLCSALTGKGIDQLQKVLAGKISVLSGPSGVGKSTLTNLLIGSEVQRVGEISQKLGRGQHVTTRTRMLRLPKGGYIVDTPGIQDISIWELTRDELPAYFHEFEPWAESCQYQPCSHIHEPHCGVRAAVEQGHIPKWRYEHYCRLWLSLPKYEYEWRTRRR
ncbi:MAG: ribosome small subunit-dependent GTPase A [Bacteroidota bacterium]|nr:ribosome small subunit-dependent GTPase A [Bacteroidota bacterium]